MTDHRPNRRPSAETRAAQALRMIDPQTGAVVPGIEPATTFARDADYEPRQSYIYARDGGPTVERAQALIASLEEAEETLLFASGMAALVALIETVPAGAHVVAPRIMYHGGLNWLVRQQEKGRLRVSFFDQADPDDLARQIEPGATDLVWIETPTNPNWDVTDIRAAAEAAHAAGARLAADCTAAPPCTTRALDLGADYAFHSATKYLGGHSDLTAGVISCRAVDARWEELVTVRNLSGSVIAAFEAWLLIRGIRTLYVRFRQASENALAFARHFEAHPEVEAVLYPGLESHPGHAIARAQMTGGFGGMLSLMVHGSADRAKDVARFCTCFFPATSLGGVESLIEHRKAVEGPNSVVPDRLLRLSIGIEDVADLIADMEQALDRSA
ncbi:trans-sulfuration enzyme family protein [Oceanomicrobium pacificus]|uniref:Cystathionine gamma-synthase n=1 Tax=Oceanomicrobium pacificus TaxID=2692916 RepID=A0A6B0TNH9_9RHOB|nr:PLP-dependent transferase [Oceanomicrobium pacificus]MXU66160.1 cystathionine gamma-synthase [Oceanomicrobium pacificus]